MEEKYCILPLFFCLVFVTSSAVADPLQPGPKVRCPVCGMYVAPYPGWVSSLTFSEGSRLFFDGPRDLFTYIFQLPAEGRKSSDITVIRVTDHKTHDWIDARSAWFVLGSSVSGPMGEELIPFGSKGEAKAFLAERGGTALLAFDEITPTTLAELSATGGFAHTGGFEPIGVMGAHTHHPGGIMLSYRYMTMKMEGNRDGTERIGKDEVHKTFMVVPEKMTMEMHMLGAMVAPDPDLTFMAMVPYLVIKMDNERKMMMNVQRFTTKSEGVGDVKVSVLCHFFHQDTHDLIAKVGLSLPTGSIDRKDDTPTGKNQHLPYPMQLGSGTFDLLPGITYLGRSNPWFWGAQGIATFRLGENSNDYTLGNRIDLTGWLTRRVNRKFSLSVRLDGTSWGKIDGADSDLSPTMTAMTPTADPERRGGTRLDLLLGLAFDTSGGRHRGHRLTLEGGLPLYQRLDGPQLETDWKLTAGWQWTF
ncbi:MAG: transporter [Deltaproteobacteria bacterium]|nr:transporter [Deltaproteobacteria bacterium]